MDGLDRQDGSFTLKCGRCKTEIKITKDNIEDFINVYAWNHHDFKMPEKATIASFVTHDSINETLICRCGNRVER